MSKGYRDGAFALGIVVGGGIVLNLFLWLNYAARHKIESHGPRGQNAQGDQETAFWWWRWTGDLVSSGDTLAQWIMAFFTIGATIVLIFTLRSANRTNLAAIKASKAALDANQIMRDEQRAWLKINDPILTSIRANPYGFDGGDRSVWVEFSVVIENTGKSPANRAVTYRIYACGHDIFTQENKSARDEIESAETEQGITILPTENRTFRLNGVVDVANPPQGTRRTLDLWVSVGVTYKTNGIRDNKVTWRNFMLSQQQELHPNEATLSSVDLLDVEAGIAVVEFIPFMSDAT